MDCEFYSVYGYCRLDGCFCPYGGDPAACGMDGDWGEWDGGPVPEWT